MKQYLDLMREVYEKGDLRSDRTGVGVRSLFGHQMRFRLREGFPLVTTKRCHFHSILQELLWFLRGESNIKSLQAQKVRIWDEWADSEGELGPVYGVQWRAWRGPEGHIDQIRALIERLRADPYSRRHIVSAWNVADLDKMALPPCHAFFQFYVSGDALSCQLYQRSCDVFLGLPFNIASYALLTHLIAHQLNLEIGEFIWSGGDIHIYTNHLEQVDLQLTRSPRPLPSVKIEAPYLEDLSQYRAEMITLQNYDPYPAIKAPIAV